jgi:hypothetical protein
LKSGHKYCLSYFLNLANISSYTIGSIGAYFSVDSLVYNSPNYENITVNPQIEHNSNAFLSDITNWMLVQGEYRANGGERFIIIGNFRDNSSTPFLQIANFNIDSYYYIDDISLIECDHLPKDTSSLAIPNVFTPNGDGLNDGLPLQEKT